MTSVIMETASEKEDFTFKAISGQIGIDKAEGIVEAFVSGIGNRDSVGDIVISGAFNDSLKRRKPRVFGGTTGISPLARFWRFTKFLEMILDSHEKMRMLRLADFTQRFSLTLILSVVVRRSPMLHFMEMNKSGRLVTKH